MEDLKCKVTLILIKTIEYGSKNWPQLSSHDTELVKIKDVTDRKKKLIQLTVTDQ